MVERILKILFILIISSNKGYSQIIPFPNDTVCPGETVTLTFINPVNSIQWSTGSTINPITVASTVDTTFYVINDFGSANQDTFYISITIIPPHTSFIDVHSSPTCAGENVSIYLINPVNNVLWSTGATDHYIIIHPDTTTTYFVINNAGTNCADTVNVEITVYPNESPEIDFFPNDTVCLGQQITLQIQNPINVTHWSTGDTTTEIVFMPEANTLISVTNDYTGF
jgi:large repetitive protein